MRSVHFDTVSQVARTISCCFEDLGKLCKVVQGEDQSVFFYFYPEPPRDEYAFLECKDTGDLFLLKGKFGDSATIPSEVETDTDSIHLALQGIGEYLGLVSEEKEDPEIGVIIFT
jgi:hypothetical protein